MRRGWRDVMAHAFTPWEWRTRARVLVLVVVCTVGPLLGLANAVKNQIGRASDYAPGVADWSAFGLILCANALGLWLLFVRPAWRSLRRWDELHAERVPA